MVHLTVPNPYQFDRAAAVHKGRGRHMTRRLKEYGYEPPGTSVSFGPPDPIEPSWYEVETDRHVDQATYDILEPEFRNFHPGATITWSVREPSAPLNTVESFDDDIVIPPEDIIEGELLELPRGDDEGDTPRRSGG